MPIRYNNIDFTQFYQYNKAINHCKKGDRMENQDNNSGNNNKNRKHNQQTLLIIIVVSVVLFVMLSYMRTVFSSATNQKITYDAFIEKIEKGEIDSVTIGSDEITIVPKGQEMPMCPLSTIRSLFMTNRSPTGC